MAAAQKRQPVLQLIIVETPMKRPLRPIATLFTVTSLLCPLHAESTAMHTKPSQSLHAPEVTPDGLQKSGWQSIRAAHTAWEHAFMPMEAQKGHWQANNPGQQWTTKFDGRGFETKPKAASWSWGLELRSYGFGQNQQTVQGRPEVRAAGQRMTYQWDAGMQEWFVNDARGLEHGFTLSQRPDGARQGAALEVALGIRGTLKPSVATDAQTVYFRDAGGAPVLTYSGLKVWDADGKVLPSRFLSGERDGIILRVEESTARYPITIDPIAQQAYLKPAAVGASQGGDMFGCSVSVSGDTVVVGAKYENSSTTGVNSTPNESATGAGAAYVFVRSGSTWTQQAYLKAHQVNGEDEFGYSVAVSGDTLVVGARGERSSTTGINSTPNENWLNAGAAYVFVRNGSTWSQQAYLKPGHASLVDSLALFSAEFGSSVSVSGNTVVVGQPLEYSGTTGVNSTPYTSTPPIASDSGAAYVFVRSGTTWSQQAYLKASQVSAGDIFGFSVSVSGESLIVGAPNEDSNTTGVNSTPNESAANAGAAYVFTRSGSTWSQQAYLKASQVSAIDGFGSSVALSGDTVVVGAPYEDGSAPGINSTPNETAASAGAAYVFVRSGGAWSHQAYLKAHQVNAGDYFGSSVAVSGDVAVIGATEEDSSTSGVNSIPDESAPGSGAAYVYQRTGVTWNQQAYLKASQVSAYDRFGNAVAVSGQTAVIGARFESSSTTGINSTPDENASIAGAAYIFTGLGPPIPEIAVAAGSTDIPNGGSSHFGNVAVTGGTVTRTFTVTNSGAADLHLTGTPKVTVSGANAADFSVTAQPDVLVAANNGSTTFQVSFDPSAAGLRSAILSIANDDSDENPFEITILGNGQVPPTVVMNTGSLAVSSTTLTINGTGFASVNPGDNVVAFTPSGTAGTVTAATTTTLTVSVTGLTPGTLSAVVTTNGQSSGAPVQVASVVLPGGTGDVDSLNLGIPIGPASAVFCTTIQPDGKIILAGLFSQVLDVARNNIARLNADGTLDTNFDPNANGEVDSVAVQADGKVLLTGFFTSLSPNSGTAVTRNRIARLNADGSIDTGFNPSADNGVYGLAFQADGKVVINGAFTQLSPNGGAAVTRNRIARLNMDGTVDSGFNPNANSTVDSIAFQTDGKMLIGGSFTSLSPNGGPAVSRIGIARLNTDGTVDGGFTPGVNGVVLSVAVQPNGMVLFGGGFTQLTPSTGAVLARNGIARLNADGTADTGFDPNANGEVLSMAVQTDGKVLLGGGFTSFKPNGGVSVSRYCAARLNADGTVDGTFNPNAFGYVFSVAGQADGKVLLGGSFSSLYPNVGTVVSRSSFARLYNDAATQMLSAMGASQVSWQRDGAGPEIQQVSFDLSTNGGATWLPLGAGSRIGSTASWQLTGLSLPSSGSLRARGRTTAGYGNGSTGMIEQVVSFSAYSGWRAGFFNPAQLADSQISGPNADPDADGIPNLLEWAIGMSPIHTSSIATPLSTNGNNIIFNYTRSVAALNSGAAFTVQWSDDLHSSSWSAIGVSQQIKSDDGTLQQVEASLPMGTSGRRFVRLRLNSPP